MFKCQFCDTEYRQEKTLIAHMCEKKRRWNQRDERNVQIGFLSWLKFMDSIKTARKKDYTYEDFMHSKLYLDFVKFGRYIMGLNPVKPDDYVTFLITNGVKLKEWAKDSSYEVYLTEVLAKESPEYGVNRSMKFIDNWALDKNEVMSNFFKQPPAIIIQHLMSGKLSPWVIICSPSARENFLENLSEEQNKIINGIIDPARLKIKIKKHLEEINIIREILKESGL